MLLKERSHIMINVYQKLDTDINGLGTKGELFYLASAYLL